MCISLFSVSSTNRIYVICEVSSKSALHSRQMCPLSINIDTLWYLDKYVMLLSFGVVFLNFGLAIFAVCLHMVWIFFPRYCCDWCANSWWTLRAPDRKTENQPDSYRLAIGLEKQNKWENVFNLPFVVKDVAQRLHFLHWALFIWNFMCSR